MTMGCISWIQFEVYVFPTSQIDLLSCVILAAEKKTLCRQLVIDWMEDPVRRVPLEIRRNPLKRLHRLEAERC